MKIFEELPPISVTLIKNPFWFQNFNQDENTGIVRYTNNMYMKNILRTIIDPNILILLPSESSTPKGTSMQFSNITFYLEVVWYFRTFYLAVVRKIWQYGKIRIGELSIFSSDRFFGGCTQRHKNAKNTYFGPKMANFDSLSLRNVLSRQNIEKRYL